MVTVDDQSYDAASLPSSKGYQKLAKSLIDFGDHPELTARPK